jgi:hypothetical protein
VFLIAAAIADQGNATAFQITQVSCITHLIPSFTDLKSNIAELS